MPKVVDHDKQRTTFALAAMRLMAVDGLEGVTMRAVAAEAGLSYGSLFHYFRSKEELLMHAVKHSTESQSQRVNEYSTRYSGPKALEALLIDDVVEERSPENQWLLWLTFMYKAAHDPRFAELNAELIEGWLNRIRGHLRDAREAGEIPANTNIDDEAMSVWAFSAGIGQTGLLHGGWLPASRQKRLIKVYLDRLREHPG